MRSLTTLAAAVLATLVTAVGITAAVAAGGQATVAAHEVSYDLAHEDTTDPASRYGCWFEKASSMDTAEMICGSSVQMGPGAVDTYQLHHGDVPEDVWAWALGHGAVSDPADGCECLYVPIGTEFGPAGQSWVATYDGVEPVSAN